MKISTLQRSVAVMTLMGLLVAGCAGNPGFDPDDDRFKVLPQICDLVSPVMAGQLIGTPYETDTIAVETTGYCSWTYRDLGSEGAHPLERKLSLHVSLHRSNDARSGANGALEELDRLSGDSPNHFERVLGFGEYAVRSNTSEGVDYIIVVGNLNLKMSFAGVDVDAAGNTTPIPPGQAVEPAAVFAREIAANAAKP
ncbi:hypothetical protein [Saccharopolyspora spinosa]|uniref:Uncharacterized protein n=1 Tax=Saccharopolyspora spinosa TaxID=60894 RepID=A0A2N3XXL5_SACSN|nr:hypothetical protein [Saccharopolyspora spinosa]PKW15402.1 hypothetical protein A8926_3102 [Saccharopolyspora spinosa]